MYGVITANVLRVCVLHVTLVLISCKCSYRALGYDIIKAL